ncbi:polyadenylation and cleavage factor homolog 4-like isoform X2 [Aristolochia californica]|uniref:polyadenylation and cleavage factor homolog 4-like isoform X2 n=1 Tax=Aristolochia californica TaxID=171875 RepID=UPI0035D9AA21
MEMESSRRSIDRTREPGTKKPRLVGDAEFDRDRIFSQRASVGSAMPVVSRFKASDKERDDSIRGAGHYQQPPHEEQDIVSQYKTALAELIFNSKPIITNLTIIAGENTQAAKGIAATICANILEVPSEQKLPSLYLLDSIVKNIGRDYIRHFSGRLPEVFCKAYKQVDSSIHPSMRHLFGTWKGVFPQAALQIIEKELGFTPAINGSSAGAVTSRPDSQLQRPPHSIHVNPKYLEARQRLQQVRAKGTNNETTGSTVTTAEESDSSAVIGSSRPWASLPVKATNIQHSQSDHPNEAAPSKNLDAVYGGDYEYGSDFSRHSDLGIGKGRERIAVREPVDKPSRGINSANKPALGERNGLDAPNAYRNSRDPRVQANNQRQTKFMANRSNKDASENWKNSEEEEFMWEDMNSRLIDECGTEISRKDCWNTEEAEKSLKNVTRGKWMPLETELLDTSRWNSHDISRLEKPSSGEEKVPLKTEIDCFNQPRGIRSNMSGSGAESYTDTLSGGQAAFGHQTPRLWPSQDMQPSDGLKHKSLASIVSGYLPSSASRSSGTPGHLQHPLRPPSPSEPSSFDQRPHSPSSAGLMDHDLSQPPSLSQSVKRAQLVGLKRDPRIQARQESLSVAPQTQVLPLQIAKLPSSRPLQHLQSSIPSLPSFAQQNRHLPVSQQPLVEPLNQAQNSLSKPLAIGPAQAIDCSGSEDLNQSAAALSKSSKTSDLLAAIMKSGLVGTNLVTSGSPDPSHPESSHVNILPPHPSEPPPVQQTGSSTPSVGTTSHGDVPPLITHASKKVQPPLPPGPPPFTSTVGSTSPTSNSSNAVPNPLSDLLSALVAKGLISTPSTELVTQSEPQLPIQPQKQTTGLAGSSSVPVSLSVTSSTVEKSHPEPAVIATSSSKSTSIEVKYPLGTEFRSEIVREMHLKVISSLFDDLPHQCSICGLRIDLQEELSRHLDWHASKKQELTSCSKVSRTWFATIDDWVTGDMGPPLGPSTRLIEERASEVETCEPMVPADESQCICALCGEPFEDWYSDARDEWMYRGTVYLPRLGDDGVMENAEKVGIIVHTHCISQSTAVEQAAEA